MNNYLFFTNIPNKNDPCFIPPLLYRDGDLESAFTWVGVGVREAAKKLKLSGSAISQRISRKSTPFIRVNDRPFLLENAVIKEAWANAGRQSIPAYECWALDKSLTNNSLSEQFGGSVYRVYSDIAMLAIIRDHPYPVLVTKVPLVPLDEIFTPEPGCHAEFWKTPRRYVVAYHEGDTWKAMEYLYMGVARFEHSCDITLRETEWVKFKAVLKKEIEENPGISRHLNT